MVFDQNSLDATGNYWAWKARVLRIVPYDGVPQIWGFLSVRMWTTSQIATISAKGMRWQERGQHARRGAPGTRIPPAEPPDCVLSASGRG